VGPVSPLPLKELRKLSLNLTTQAPCREDVRGSGGMAPTFLTSALDGGEWSASRLCCFTTGETALRTYGTGAWVGPRVGLHVMEETKSLTPIGNRTQTPRSSIP
jgi:hypothetical protein